MTRGRPSLVNRDYLLEKGMEHFIKQGYHGTGLNSLLEACSISKGSFYNLFKNKELFAVEIIHHYQAIARQHWRNQLTDVDGEYLTKIGVLLGREAVHFEHNRYNIVRLLANLSGEVNHTTPVLQAALSRAVESFISLIEQNMRASQEKGLIRNDIPPRQLALLVWNSWQGALLSMNVTDSINLLTQYSVSVQRLLLSLSTTAPSHDDHIA